MSDEPRMTFAEWTQIQAKNECDRSGHDWQIVSSMAGPIGLYCDRPCGHPGYRVMRVLPPGEEEQ